MPSSLSAARRSETRCGALSVCMDVRGRAWDAIIASGACPAPGRAATLAPSTLDTGLGRRCAGTAWLQKLGLLLCLHAQPGSRVASAVPQQEQDLCTKGCHTRHAAHVRAARRHAQIDAGRARDAQYYTAASRQSHHGVIGTQHPTPERALRSALPTPPRPASCLRTHPGPAMMEQPRCVVPSV